MIVRVVPSIHRPWQGGGFFSCDFFPETRFTELSARVEVRQLRDARGRWRRVRGVREILGEAAECAAQAFRCRDPAGHEGYIVVGEGLGVMMYGVGDAGMGNPLIWVDDVRDFPPAVATQFVALTQPVDPQPGPSAPGSPLITLDTIHQERPSTQGS